MGDRIQVLMDQVKPEPAVGDKFVSIDGTEYVIHECDCWTHGCHDKVRAGLLGQAVDLISPRMTDTSAAFGIKVAKGGIAADG